MAEAEYIKTLQCCTTCIWNVAQIFIENLHHIKSILTSAIQCHECSLMCILTDTHTLHSALLWSDWPTRRGKWKDRLLRDER